MSRVLTERVDDTRPIVMSRQGPRLLTDDGCSLLEISGGSHASCIVHDGGDILRTAFHSMNGHEFALSGRSVAHKFQVELADLVSEQVGDVGARTYFTSGGTESLETAIRLAYYIQEQRGRTAAAVVIGRRYSYHGMSVLARNIAHHPVHSKMPIGVMFDWPKLPEPQPNDLVSADRLESLIEELGPAQVAAVVVEPIAGTTGGALLPPKGYIERIHSICRKYGVLLIVDEVVTAFFRTGDPFVCSTSSADIILGGKCLAGGMAPIGCVIVGATLAQEMRTYAAAAPVPLRLTFAGNALACAVAVSAQKYVSAHHLAARIKENGPIIENTLRTMCEVKSLPAIVHGRGHLWGLELPVECGQAEASYERLRAKGRDKNYELMGGWRQRKGYESIHLLVTPAFDVTEPELLEILDGATELLTTLTH